MAGLSSIRAKVKSCSHALNQRMRAHDARDGIRVFRGLSLPYSAESVLLPRTHEEQERVKQEADIQRFQMFLLPIKFQYIRGKEKGRGTKKHQEIPSFQSSLLLKSADDRQKKMQNNKQKTEKQ